MGAGRRREPRARRSTRVAEAAEAGAEIVCLPELFRSPLLLPDARTHAYFDLAEPIPGPTTRGARRGGARGTASSVVALALRAARGRASTTTPPSILDADGTLLGPLPQDAHPRRSRSTTRSSTSRPATSASGPSTRAAAASARWSAGTSGIPKAARLTALRGRRASSSTRRRSAGTRARRPSTARRSTTPGRRSSARTPSPTASTSRR